MTTDEAPRRIAVRAPDGIELVGAATGQGPGLLFVYGALMEQTGWARLLPHLPGRTLYTYDRRGRGASGDRQQYTVDAEVADLLAFAGALPRPLDVFAHSSGALLALHAAERGLQGRRLVLYEPLVAAARSQPFAQDFPDRILDLVEGGDPDAALELFLREGMSLPEADIDRIRDGERWRDQTRYVRTAAYDARITSSFDLDPQRLARIDSPVLLLEGSESPPWIREGVQRIARALPDAGIETIDGHGHNAQFTAPALLAARIASFL